MTKYLLLTEEEVNRLANKKEIVYIDCDGVKTVIAMVATNDTRNVSEIVSAIHNRSDEPYKPVCPRGYTDCVLDPAYIQYRHPEWYKEMYGDLSPEEAARTEDSCYDRFRKDPEELFYCYDDEDK